MPWWLQTSLGLAVALLLAWAALLTVLLISKPEGQLLKEALRLLPNRVDSAACLPAEARFRRRGERCRARAGACGPPARRCIGLGRWEGARRIVSEHEALFQPEVDPCGEPLCGVPVTGRVSCAQGCRSAGQGVVDLGHRVRGHQHLEPVRHDPSA
jgi:hypothetical protein